MRFGTTSEDPWAASAGSTVTTEAALAPEEGSVRSGHIPFLGVGMPHSLILCMTTGLATGM